MILPLSNSPGFDTEFVTHKITVLTMSIQFRIATSGSNGKAQAQKAREL